MSVLLAVALTLGGAHQAPVPDQLAETGKAMQLVAAFVHDAEAADIEQTMADAADRFGAWLREITPPARAPVPAAVPQSNRSSTGSASQVAGGGGHSDAWWAAIATCESGGVSGWRTGYFGIMDGSAAGSMPYDAQLARARQIWAGAGDGAWGCSSRAYDAVPGG